MNTFQLSDLLPEKDINRLVPILERIAARKVDVSEGKRLIMEILKPREKELEEKGVLAEYLAWYLVAHASQAGGRKC